MYRWLLPPKLIIASLLSSDWIIFWHHHHSHILGSMTVIIILKVNFSWKGGDIEIICVWKSKVWAESTHYEVRYIYIRHIMKIFEESVFFIYVHLWFHHFFKNQISIIIDFIFWLIHVIIILFFSFFLGPFFGLCGVLLFTTHMHWCQTYILTRRTVS